jgi:hypothetical protein
LCRSKCCQCQAAFLPVRVTVGPGHCRSTPTEVLPLTICMCVWQGVAKDYLKFYPGPPCLTLLCPTGEGGTPETVLRPFQGWPAPRASGLRPSSTLLDTRRRRTMTICRRFCVPLASPVTLASQRISYEWKIGKGLEDMKGRAESKNRYSKLFPWNPISEFVADNEESEWWELYESYHFSLYTKTSL